MKTEQDYASYEPIGSGLILSIEAEDVNGLVLNKGVLVKASEDRQINPIQECLVIAAGRGCKQVHAGDRVLFNLHNAPPIKAGDNEVRFTQEEHVMCITKRNLSQRMPPIDLGEHMGEAVFGKSGYGHNEGTS